MSATRALRRSDFLRVGRSAGLAIGSLLLAESVAASPSNNDMSAAALGGGPSSRMGAIDIDEKRLRSESEFWRAHLATPARYQEFDGDTALECQRVPQSPGERVLSCTLALLHGTHNDGVRARLYAERASAYYLAGEWKIALRDFARALELDPELPFALNGRCWILASQNLDLAQARRDCDRALAIDPTFHEAFDSRAIIDMREGDWAGAWQDFNAAVNLRSDVPAFLYGRGLSSLALGNQEAAQRDMAAAIAMNPGVVADYRRLGFDASALQPGTKPGPPSGQ